MKKAIILILSFLLPVTAFAVTSAPFNSGQEGSSASNAYVLQTNGNTSTWVGTSTLGLLTFSTTSISATFPIFWNTNTAQLNFNGLSTSTAGVVGNIPYFSSANQFANVATTTASCSGSASCSPFTIIGSSPITISASGGGGGNSFGQAWEEYGSPKYLAPTTTLGIILSASSTIQNLSGTYGTTTFATTTNFYATTASTTNLYGANLASCTGGTNALTWTAGMFGCQSISAGAGWATSSSDYYASLFRDWSMQGNGYLAPTTTRGILVAASSTISNLTAITSTTTSATTTNLAVTSVTSHLLKTDANGVVVAATAGSDYQATGNYITALTGDVTASGPGSVGATLATVNTNTGTFGGVNSIPSFTVNGKGLITAASANTPAIPASEIMSGTFGSGNYIFPSQLQVNSSTTLQNFTALLATTSAATSTSFFSTTASSTNLYTSNELIATTSQSQSALLSVAGNVFSGGTIYANNFFDTSVSGSTCIGETNGLIGTSNCVSSLASSGGTVTVSSPTGAVNIDMALSHGNVWTASTTFAGGLTATSATTTNATTTVLDIAGLTSNGFVKTSGGNGTLSVDTNTYLTGNQTITLSGVVSGSGATGITTSYSGLDPRAWNEYATAGYIAPTSTIGIIVNAASSTVTNLAMVNSTSTYATSTNLYTSGQTILAALGGNVGIGTTSPVAKLDVTGSTNNVLYLRTADSPSMSFIDGGSNNWALQAVNGNRLRVVLPNSTEALSILTTGNVGIGTTSPSSKLAISGSLNAIQLESAMGIGNPMVIGSNYTGTGDVKAQIQFLNPQNAYSSALAFATQPNTQGAAVVERMRIDQSGNVGIGTTNPIYKLAVSNSGANGLEIDPTSSSGTQTAILSYNRSSSAYTPLVFSANQFNFQTPSATNALFITSGGNVGIGTTNPQAKLDVQGTASSTNLFVQASSTLQNYTALNATTTQATTTNFSASAYHITIGSNNGFVSGTSTASFNLASTSLDAMGKSFNIGTSTFLLRNNPTSIKLLGFYCVASSTGTALVTFSHDNGNHTETSTCTSGGYTQTNTNNTFTANEDFNVQASSTATASVVNRITVTPSWIITSD